MPPRRDPRAGRWMYWDDWRRWRGREDYEEYDDAEGDRRYRTGFTRRINLNGSVPARARRIRRNQRMTYAMWRRARDDLYGAPLREDPRDDPTFHFTDE